MVTRSISFDAITWRPIPGSRVSARLRLATRVRAVSYTRLTRRVVRRGLGAASRRESLSMCVEQDGQSRHCWFLAQAHEVTLVLRPSEDDLSPHGRAAPRG